MKKVYRVVAVLLMCFCLVAAVAETAGSAVLREMNMMIPGEGNSVTVGTFYQILCENCKVVTSATTPSTSGAFLYRDEYYASAGNTVDVIFDPSAVPRDKYFLGNFLSDPQVTFNSPDGETFFFTMPAQDITVTAELANRETVTFDLTQKDTIDVDESAAQFLTEYAVEMLSVTYADPLLLDLNADGELEPASACDYAYLESAFGNDQAFFLKTIGSVNMAEMQQKLVDNPRQRQNDTEMIKTIDSVSMGWFNCRVLDLPLEKKARLLPYIFRSYRTTIAQLARCFGLAPDAVIRMLRLPPKNQEE